MQVHIMAPGSTVNSLSVVRIWHYCVETVVSQEQVRARARARSRSRTRVTAPRHSCHSHHIPHASSSDFLTIDPANAQVEAYAVDAGDFGRLFSYESGHAHLFPQVQKTAAKQFEFEADPKAPTSLGRPSRRKVGYNTHACM